MTSAIVYETIDAAYPVAGVDNDTQGFRDNFSIIQTGLQTAKTEIDALQSQTVKLVTDSGVAENDFKESSILDASLDHVTFKLKANTVQTENVTVNVDVSNGHYQVYTLGPSVDSGIQFSISGWPVRNTNPGVAKVTLHITSAGAGAKEVKFVAANSGAIFKDDSWPTSSGAASDTDDAASIDVDNANRPVIVEFWTYNSGDTVYANYLGKFRKSSDNA